MSLGGSPEGGPAAGRRPVVLVAGAGPVGLVMAAELARFGIPVRIVDKAGQRSDKSKALVIWSRTLELMDRMGCSGAFLKAGLKVSAANIVAGDKEIARLTFDGVATPHPYALTLPQSDTERFLESHLNACGVEVERNVELTKLVASGQGVVSTLRRADGGEETLASSWLIGCDGAHSCVRHQLGVQFVGDTLPSQWILADVQLSSVPHPGEINVFWHEDGVLAIFPITQDRYRVIADIAEAGTAPPADPVLEQVQAVLARRGPGGIQASAPRWLAGFRITERKVADYRLGRVFLAGDAAHIHSPAGGQGMNTGIQDACNLAWKLALVERGLCAEEPLLASYSIERSAVGDQVLAGASRVTSLALMRGTIQQSIRNHLASLLFGIPAIRNLLANAASEISLGYPRSPLTVRPARSRGPEPGSRAPIRGDEPLVGAGRTPRFALFADPGEGPNALLRQYPGLLEPAVRKPFHQAGVWLVRPDGYTSLAGGDSDWPQVAAFLQGIARFPGD